MTLSKSTELTIMALLSGDSVFTIRHAPPDARYDGDDWSASVMPIGGVARFTVPIQTFRKMRRDGLLVKETDWQLGNLIFSNYILTDKGRNAL